MSLSSLAVGAFNTTRTNHTLVCLPDPFTDVQGQPASLPSTHLLSALYVTAMLLALHDRAAQHTQHNTRPGCIRPT